MAVEYDHLRDLFATQRLRVEWKDGGEFFDQFVQTAMRSHIPSSFATAVNRVHTQVENDKVANALADETLLKDHLYSLVELPVEVWREVAFRIFERPFWSPEEVSIVLAYGEAVSAVKIWQARSESRANPQVELDAKNKHYIFVLLQDRISAKINVTQNSPGYKLRRLLAGNRLPDLDGAIAMTESYFANPQKQARIFFLSQG